MRKFSYRIISFVMGICLAVSLSGCAGKAGQGKEKGTYVEKEVVLPEDITAVYDIQAGKDGAIVMFAAMADSDCILFKTTDRGESWEEMTALPEELKKDMIFSGAVKEDGSVIFAAYKGLLEKMDQEVDLIQEPKSYGVIDKEGNFRPFTADVRDNGMIADFYIYEDRVFFCDINGYYYELKESGAKILNPEADTYGTPYGLAVSDDVLLGMNGEGLEQYDINTGKAADAFRSFADFCLEKMGNETTSPILYASGEGEMFYLGQTGLFRYNEEEKSGEKILDGERYQFGKSDVTLKKIQEAGKDAYAVLSYEGSRPAIYLYEYDENASAKEQKELTVYMLQKDSAMQAVIDGFREKYPDILVHTETGTDESMGLTFEDAVRSLNVSLFADDGPDILVLDGLPADSYIRQKKLADITDAVSSQPLESAVAKTYEREGKIWAVPLKFSLLDIHATSQVLEKGMGLEEIAQQAEALKKKGVAAVDLWEGESIFSSLFYYYFPDCMKDGKIDGGELGEMFQNMKKIYDNSEYNWTVELEGETGVSLAGAFPGNMENGSMMLHIGESQLMAGKLGSLPAIQLAYLLRAKNPDIKCGFFDDMLQKQYFAETSLGISASAKSPDEAKKFVEYAVSEEGQKRIKDLEEGFPVNEVSLDQVFKSEYAKSYEYAIEDRDGKQVVVKAEGNIKKDDYRKWKDRLKGYKTPAFQDAVIREMVLNAAADYMNGNLELDAAVKQCAQSIELYLNE